MKGYHTIEVSNGDRAGAIKFKSTTPTHKVVESLNNLINSVREEQNEYVYRSL